MIATPRHATCTLHHSSNHQDEGDLAESSSDVRTQKSIACEARQSPSNAIDKPEVLYVHVRRADSDFHPNSVKTEDCTYIRVSVGLNIIPHRERKWPVIPLFPLADGSVPSIRLQFRRREGGPLRPGGRQGFKYGGEKFDVPGNPGLHVRPSSAAARMTSSSC